MTQKSVTDNNPGPEYNRPEIKISLRIVFLVPFMLQIILITGLVGYLSFRTGRKAVYEVAGRLHHEINTRINEYLENRLNTPEQVIQNNAAAIEQGRLDCMNPEILEHYFMKQIQIYSSISSITFGNSYGGAVHAGRDIIKGSTYIIASDGFAPGRLNKYMADAGGNRRGLVLSMKNFNATKRPWYKAAITKKGIVWSGVYLFITEHDMALSVSMPVYTGETMLAGVISADLFLSHISNFLASMNIGKTGVCFIIEKNGKLIATSSGEQIFTQGNNSQPHKRLDATESSKKLICSTAARLLSQFGNYGMITSDYQTIFQADDDTVHVTVHPFGENHGLDWLVATVIPEKDFMDSILANTKLTVLLVVIALFVSAIVAYFTTRCITAPVLRLQSSVQEMSAGKWPQNVTGSRIIEISDLKKSFYKMSMQLRELIDSLMLEVNDRRQAEDALRKSEEKYRELVELSNSIIIRRDISGKLTFINEYAQKFFGYTADEIIGRNIVGTLVPFHDKDGRDLQQMIHDIGANPELYVRNENENMRKDGSAVWIVWSNRGIMDENGNCAEILGVGTDITERRLAEIQIRKLLAEKELILQEVHHRIKNNMNTISVLLHLQSQSASIKDGAAAAVLQDARSRVLSMMLIYDKLYDSRDFRNISTRSYFPDLINGISSTFPNYERVAIKTRIDELVMDSNILAPAGIIINELLTNAFKYAFTYMEQGKIEISFLKRGDRSFEIIFCDNGCGMPESVVPGKSEGFGLNLVNILVRQMDGTFEIIRNGGTTFIIRFMTEESY